MNGPGESGIIVRELPGVAPELVQALVEAVDAFDESCDALASGLDTGSVHAHAFGKLIGAVKVRDAYHDRLPKTRENLGEAREVARSFRDELAEPGPLPLPAQREAGPEE